MRTEWAVTGKEGDSCSKHLSGYSSPILPHGLHRGHVHVTRLHAIREADTLIHKWTTPTCQPRADRCLGMGMDAPSPPRWATDHTWGVFPLVTNLCFLIF